MATQPATTPAPFESSAWIPASARLSPLAQAALKAGVEPSAVRAYLSSLYSAQPNALEVFAR